MRFYISTFCAALLFAVSGPSRADDLPTALSAEDLRKGVHITAASWRRLKAGEILTSRRTDAALGGQGLAFCKQPAWKIFQVITDFPTYPKFFPRNLKAEIISSSENGMQVKTELIAAGPGSIIWNESRITVDRKNSKLLAMAWKAEKTNLRFNDGFWLLDEQPEGTLIVYQTHFQLATGPLAMAKPHAEKTLRINLKAIMERSREARYEAFPGKVDFLWRLEKASTPVIAGDAAVAPAASNAVTPPH